MKTRVKNLDTGVEMNVGSKFLGQQCKPFIGKSGKMYPDGVWVEIPGKPISAEAKKVIEDAAKPVQPPPAQPMVPTAPVAPVEVPDPVAPVE